MTLRKKGALLVLLAALAAVAGVAAGTATTAVKSPIVIGWAYDTTGSMAPFDVSAVASAKLRIKAKEDSYRESKGRQE